MQFFLQKAVNFQFYYLFSKVKEMMHKKWPKAKYIGYFQANTNTYADVNTLKEKYEQFLDYETRYASLKIKDPNLAEQLLNIQKQIFLHYINIQKEYLIDADLLKKKK